MASSIARRRIYWTCMAVIGLLYLLSVPWYRDANQPLTLWLGLPDWVAVSVLCYVAVAVVNALAWIVTDVPDEAVDADPGRERSGIANGPTQGSEAGR